MTTSNSTRCLADEFAEHGAARRRKRLIENLTMVAVALEDPAADMADRRAGAHDRVRRALDADPQLLDDR